MTGREVQTERATDRDQERQIDRLRKRHTERQRGAETDRDEDRQRETQRNCSREYKPQVRNLEPRYNLLFPLASQTPARRASGGHLENKRL